MGNLREKYLKMSNKAFDALKTKYRVKKDEKSAELWILTKEEEVASLQLDLETEYGKESFDMNAVLLIKDKIDLANRKLKQGKELLEDLFGDGR